MPATSEARIRANQANSLKSSGPRTPEGKAASRRNGLKHGLTGAGVVVAECDAPEVERRHLALRAELDPKSTLGQVLVGQLATLSVRMERGASEELAASASRVRHAVESFDHDRVDRAEDLFDAIADDPRRHLRLLKRMPEGVDRLVEGWGELRDLLTRTEVPYLWEPSHEAMAIHLGGHRPDQAKGTRLERLSAAVRGRGSLVNPEWVALDLNARRSWARDRLVEWIDGQIAALVEHRERLDLEAIELDRIEAPARATFDPSRDATLARRYESEARRMFFKALKDFRQAEAEAADRPACPASAIPQAPPEPLPAPGPRVPASLASSREEPSPALREAGPAPFDDVFGPIGRAGEQARGLDGRALAVGRAVAMSA